MAAQDDEGADQAESGNGGKAPRPARAWPVEVYLALLAAVIIVPSLIFTLVLLDRNGQAQRDLLETLAHATAGSISEAVDRELLGMFTTLRVLSTAESLARGDLANFHARAQAALEDRGAFVILLDRDDSQLLNTRVPFGTPLGKAADSGSAAMARRTGQPVVSDVFYGNTSKSWVFNTIVALQDPARGDTLVMTQNAENLSRTLSQKNLTGGWNVSLLDRRGVVLTSSFNSSDAGKPFFLGQGTVSGRLTGRIEEGAREESYIVATTRSPVSGWQVVVWAPAAAIDAPLRRSMLMLLLGSIAVLAFATLAAWLLGRQIASPIRRLVRDARRLGAGEEVQPVAYPVTEISTVSAAIAQASADRRQAENEIRFLMREVAHRSKNQLTVVSSIAKQTGRHAASLAVFQESFQRRLLGLARSTDLLIAGGVAGVELRELMKAQLEPFLPPEEERIEIAGPAFRLDNSAAQTLGLAAHELATNAAKYGAFSISAGRLRIAWRIDGDRLSLQWREYVPRLPPREETPGFGTQVIERMLGGSLDAEITRMVHENGLEYSFVIPLAKLRPAMPPHPDAAQAARR